MIGSIKKEKEGVALGVGIILLGIFFFDLHEIFIQIDENIAIGIFSQYVGLIFLLSYFYQSESFLFRSIIWICNHLSWPRNSKMAFVYSAVFFIAGTYKIVW